MGIMLEKKNKLQEGEMVELCFDEAFRIMYANDEHLEVLTMLLSKILNVDYSLLEGNITLKPRKSTNLVIGEKKNEKDVVVSVKLDENYNVVLEVNVSETFYQSTIDRNLYYTFQEAGHTLVEKETYDKLPYTILVNFNTYFVNQRKKNIFEEFTLQDEDGLVLTEKVKVLNINIAECFRLWYHNKYQGKFESYKEDLVLLCAAMIVKKEEDFKEIVKMFQMKPEIKKLMEGLVRQMNHNERLIKEYGEWKNEYDRINASIISEVSEKILKEGHEKGLEEGIHSTKVEMVMNMHNDNVAIELISKYTNLSVSEVQDIINNSKN